MGATAVGLLAITLLIGSSEGGAKAWLRFGSLSLQTSEVAKICYIFAGAATLDRLFNKRNLWMFIGLTGVCGGCLALQNDFGTALVFFVTFLVIAYLRSGDFATLGLVCAGCFGGGMVMLTIKPHVAARFASWGHIWEDVYDKGFQQTHTLTAAASGGLIGVGAGKGWLSGLPAADTDIVFGMLCEEWGLVIAVLTVLCIITLAVFAVRACRAGRARSSGLVRGTLPDGRHLLCRARRGRRAVRRGGPPCQKGRHALRDRGDEAHERDHRRTGRHDRRDLRAEWAVRRIRHAPVPL